MTVLAHLQPLGSSLTVRFAERLSTGETNGFYRPLRPVRPREARQLLAIVNEPGTLDHAVIAGVERTKTGPRATARVVGLTDPQRVKAILYHVIGFALETITQAHIDGKIPGSRGWTIGIEDGHVILDPGPDDVKSCLWVLEKAVARLDEGA